jgi:hypothetical protein
VLKVPLIGCTGPYNDCDGNGVPDTTYGLVLAGRALDASSAPLSGRTLDACAVQGDGTCDPAAEDVTGPDGTFALMLPFPGRYRVGSPPGGVLAELDVEDYVWLDLVLPDDARKLRPPWVSAVPMGSLAAQRTRGVQHE